MPHERVLWVDDPVVLVGEVEEPAGNATLLEHVEETETFGDSQTEVEVAVDHESGGDNLDDVLGLGGIPHLVVLAGFPECAVKLKLMLVPRRKLGNEVDTYVVVDEEELFSADLACAHPSSVVGDGGLKVATEWCANDPVHHEATERGTGSNAVLDINVVEVVTNILPAENEVLERSTTPVVLDVVNELLAKASAAGGVGGHNDVTLVSPNTGVPASAPAVGPRALGTTVDEEGKRVFLLGVESGWLDDPSMILTAIILAKLNGIQVSAGVQ